MRLKGKVKKADFETMKDDEKAHYEPWDETAEWYVLKEGETEDVTGLKSALQKERDQSSERQRKLEALKDVDPEKYRRLVQEEATMNEQREAVEQRVASVNADWEKKHERETKKLNERIMILDKVIDEALVDNALISAMGDKVISPTLLLPHARTRVKRFEEGGKFVVRVVDDKGQPRMSQKSKDSSPMTLGELVDEMGEEDTYKPIFKAKVGAGSGSPGPQPPGGGGGGQVPTLSREDAKDPAKYRAAKEQAIKAGFGDVPQISPPDLSQQ